MQRGSKNQLEPTAERSGFIAQVIFSRSSELLCRKVHAVTEYTKMLSSETIDEVAALVRSGFYDKNRLMAIFCEEMYAPL